MFFNFYKDFFSTIVNLYFEVLVTSVCNFHFKLHSKEYLNKKKYLNGNNCYQKDLLIWVFVNTICVWNFRFKINTIFWTIALVYYLGKSSPIWIHSHYEGPKIQSKKLGCFISKKYCVFENSTAYCEVAPPF